MKTNYAGETKWSLAPVSAAVKQEQEHFRVFTQ